MKNKKVIRLVNDERKNTSLHSSKGCSVGVTDNLCSSVDVCHTMDAATCQLYSSDICYGKDLAACYSQAYDRCGGWSDDTVACMYGANDYE